jgi:hypothetical protein
MERTVGFVAPLHYQGIQYNLDVKSFLELSEQDRKEYRVYDGDFLVNLSSPEGSKRFKVFVGDDLFWTTNASPIIIDPELVEQIGFMIHNHTA